MSGPIGAGASGADAQERVLDPGALGRRLGRTLAIIATVVVALWAVEVVRRGAPALDRLGALVGFGLAAAFVGEVVVVGGGAVRGMLAAGARGERLAGSDVTLLPPQLVCMLRRARGRRDAREVGRIDRDGARGPSSP